MLRVLVPKSGSLAFLFQSQGCVRSKPRPSPPLWAACSGPAIPSPSKWLTHDWQDHGSSVKGEEKENFGFVHEEDLYQPRGSQVLVIHVDSNVGTFIQVFIFRGFAEPKLAADTSDYLIRIKLKEGGKKKKEKRRPQVPWAPWVFPWMQMAF